MSSKDAHLYGTRPARKVLNSTNSINPSANAFASSLSSLIASSSSTRTPRVQRSSNNKDDIFTNHNRNTRKRAAADMTDSAHTLGVQKHSTSSEMLEDAQWHRSKRRLEEKTRLYNAMKRGEMVDDAERHMVDFDQKWAQKIQGQDLGSSEESEAEEVEGEELIDYTDEFGRTRTGTKREAEREERRRNMQTKLGEDTLAPQRPEGIIYGDTIQHAAFNPDEPIAVQMAELAAKRDRELTPPEATHYDATKEVRNKGAGFFQFSKDEETRQEQMQALERERRETEKTHNERSQQLERKKEAREKEIEERRKKIRDKRGQMRADSFLEGLGKEMEGNEADTRAQPESSS